MKPEIVVSASDSERLEGLLATAANRSRSDLDGLREELERAKIVDDAAMPSGVVRMSSRARFREDTSGVEYEYTLAWPHEADVAQGRVSIFTPAGSALLGLAVGQGIDWTTADGHPIHLTVLEVMAPLASQSAA